VRSLDRLTRGDRPTALIQGGSYGPRQSIAVERLAEERDSAGLQEMLALPRSSAVKQFQK